MVEEPGWAVEFARLTALGMRLLPVPRRADGPDLEVMAQVLRGAQAQAVRQRERVPQPDRLLPVARAARTACCSWPTSTTSTSSRTTPTATSRPSTPRGCARWTACSAPSTSAASPRSWRRTGASASWPRHPSLIERLLDTKLLATLTTPGAAGEGAGAVHRAGPVAPPLPSASARGWTRRAAAASSWRWTRAARFAAEPAGLFGWVDTGVDTDALAQRMLDEGYLLAPGALFHARAQAQHADAHQLRDHAGRGVLEEIRGAGARM